VVHEWGRGSNTFGTTSAEFIVHDAFVALHTDERFFAYLFIPPWLLWVLSTASGVSLVKQNDVTAQIMQLCSGIRKK
jgi:hypothetical protein